MTKATIKFYPHQDKKSKKTGKIPMYLRITNNSQKAECRLPIEVCEIELPNWDVSTQRFKNNKSDVNRFLNKYEKEFEDLKYSFALNLNAHSASEILNRLTGSKNKNIDSIGDYFKNYYEKKVLPDTFKSEGTKKNYNKALDHILRYLDYINKKNMLLRKLR